MTNIQLFQNPDFGEIRTITQPDGTILYCASDVAKALGYAKPNNAVNMHVKGYTLKQGILTEQGNTVEMVFITKPDVIRLITHSKLPNAQRFEQWLFEDIAPKAVDGELLTIEQAYSLIADPDSMIKIATNWKKDRDRANALEAENNELRPKALFADTVGNSDTLILVRDMAHILRQNGVDIGEKRLYTVLREKGYVEKHRNEPTQRSLDLGIMRVVATTITKPDGTTFINRTCKVTGKGQKYFVDLFLSGRLVA